MDKLTAYLLLVFLDQLGEKIKGVNNITETRDDKAIEREINKINERLDELCCKLYDATLEKD